VIFVPLEPQLVELDKGNMVIRFGVDESMMDHPVQPVSATAVWALCTTGSGARAGAAVGVGHLDACGDLAGFYKFRAPLALKDDAEIFTVEMEIFFVFDIDEICNILGHTGCSSTQPCPLCDIRKADLGTAYDELQTKPARRTSTAMHECKRRFDEAGAIKENAKDFLNVTSYPMLSEHWDLEKKIVVPQVHAVTIGMGNTIYDTLLRQVRIDENTLGSEEAREAMETAKAGILSNTEQLAIDSKERTLVGKDVARLKDQCCNLLVSYHKPTVTTGISAADLKKDGIDADTISQYGILNRMVKDDAARCKAMTKSIAELKEEIGEQQEAYDDFKAPVFDIGPIEMAIEGTWLSSANVSHSTYHKRDFVGGGIKRIGFARLLHLTSATRMLPSEEKTEVLGLCRSVPGLIRAARPNAQIKTHMIEFELHDFIEYWGTIGILNEEAFESIHAHQNNMVRRFACVRNRNHRDELMQRAFDMMQKTKAKTGAMVAERCRPKRRKSA
ncbi:hypothetical protein M885DRAFT_580594, partial [Pelagophyceae sp. CCMP2097]